MALNIEVKDHPARASHPITHEPLLDDNGNPVPLFPEEKSVWLDGSMVAYIGSPPGRALMFITPKERLGAYVVDRIREQVLVQTNHEVKKLVSVPEPQDEPESDDD